MIEKITNKVSNVAKRCTSFIKRCGMSLCSSALPSAHSPRMQPVTTLLCPDCRGGSVHPDSCAMRRCGMNNEEQDVKNILVLQNRQETRRKEMKLNSLLHNTLCRYFNFPIFENVLLKNI
jgi:hypothetical protein